MTFAQFERTWGPIISAFIIGAFIFASVKSCSPKITDYTGWTHECERSGGVPHDGRCFDPDALVDMEASQ